VLFVELERGKSFLIGAFINEKELKSKPLYDIARKHKICKKNVLLGALGELGGNSNGKKSHEGETWSLVVKSNDTANVYFL